MGRILATTGVEVPWWRVVAASGHLRAGDTVAQSELLRAEEWRRSGLAEPYGLPAISGPAGPETNRIATSSHDRLPACA